MRKCIFSALKKRPAEKGGILDYTLTFTKKKIIPSRQWGNYSLILYLLQFQLKPYQPEIIGIPEDDYGIVPETLEASLHDRLSRGLKMPKILYTIPTGSNPTGTVLPEDRRRRIYELACQFDFLILEDDPYMFINYTEVCILK